MTPRFASALVYACEIHAGQLRKGTDIPYRVYKIEGSYYFEFFSLPYDQHSNPGNAKGIIFDTNLTYDLVT